jgi:acyl-CoA oxidase
LQALCTWITCEGIERCRFQCGGHGYSLLSGLPTIYASYVQNATWEGDNNVLCLQVLTLSRLSGDNLAGCMGGPRVSKSCKSVEVCASSDARSCCR